MSSQKVLIPEVVEPDSALPRDLVALRKLAFLLDSAIEIPGLRKKLGLDPIIGLIPGVGDAVGAVLGAWIVVGALRHRVPASKIGRMVANILIDMGVGAIPVLGDLVDWFFPENLQNVNLLLRYRNRQLPPRSFGSIALAMILILTGLFAASILAILFAGWMVYTLLRDIPLL